MPITDTKTTKITALDASGTKFAGPANALLADIISLEVATTDSIGSTKRFFRVPSNAVITGLDVKGDAATAGAADIGLCDISSGAAVSAALFGSAVSFASALNTWTDVQTEATSTDIDKSGKKLWELLGLTSDPGKAYDVTATLTTAWTAAGTVAMRIQYFLP